MIHRRYSACIVQVVEIAATEEKGGCKFASATISGQGVYGRLKYESGIHRVQRVPSTEASGRLHTSAASVAILPQADEVTTLKHDGSYLLTMMVTTLYHDSRYLSSCGRHH